MAVFTVGLALSFATGDARFMLAKDSVGTAVAGLIFLGTCVVGRPMTFYAAQRFSATSEKQTWWNIKWQTSPGFRRGFRVMSMVWGVGLLIEAAMRIPLIYVLPIHVMVGLSTVLQAAVFTLLIAWTMWYARPDRDSAPNSAFHRHGNRYSAGKRSLVVQCAVWTPSTAPPRQEPTSGSAD
ncbi:MAG TPA: VC0807 family protein [Pseudonocardiaceae bacterium]|nr:VC0807 family protein [Pseudonocardiaceae bacterium]